MADWKALEVKIPGKDLLDSARSILETLVTFLEILKALLQVVQAFLIDFGNPVRALVEALLALIKQLFESLKQTGMFYYEDIPNPLVDPGFHRHVGGYQAFTQRFIGSLYDGRDPFRPQPAPGITKSGFLLIVADAESVFGLLRLLRVLMRFFGKEFLAPMYAPPGNPKVLLAGAPIGSTAAKSTDPILQVATVFGAQLKGLVLEWGPSSNTVPPTPDFEDLVGSAAAEFVPQKFLIERSAVVPTVLTHEVTTTFEDKRGRPIKRKARVKDENGELVKHFQEYYVIDPSVLTIAKAKFRWLDENAKEEVTYYYRIRAFSGDLDISGTSLNFKDPEQDPLTQESIQRWPSKDPQNPVVMGRPTGILTGRVPKIPANFDVIANLEALFKTSYSLGFHLPVSPDARFDTQGRPVSGTSVLEVGRGSLTNKGGVLSGVLPQLPDPQTVAQANEVTNAHPELMHTETLTVFQAKRMAQTVATSLLETPGAPESFRATMQGSAPNALSPPAGTNLSGADTIEKQVFGFVKVADGFPETFDPAAYKTYDFGYADVNFRLNVLSAVRFILSFSLGGQPPDWKSVSLLRDIIPWSGQFIYDLLARIEALLAAFQGIIDEIKAYIDLIIRKIDVLERFLKYLIQILNFLDSFSVGFYLLKVSSTDGGIPDWVNQVQNAGGTRPPSGPGGYSGGVALAWAAPNIGAFTEAIDILF